MMHYLLEGGHWFAQLLSVLYIYFIMFVWTVWSSVNVNYFNFIACTTEYKWRT